jgi:hypothetical protein
MDPDLRSVKPNQPSDPRERPFHPARHLALRTHVLLVHFSPRRLAARGDQGARPGHRLRDPGQLRHRRRPRRGRRAAQGAAASRAPASRAPHSAATAAAPRRHAGAPRALRHTTPPRPAPPLPPAHGPLGQGRLSGTSRPRCVAVASRQCAGTHTDIRAAWRRGDARDPAAVLIRAPVVAHWSRMQSHRSAPCRPGDGSARRAHGDVAARHEKKRRRHAPGAALRRQNAEEPPLSGGSFWRRNRRRPTLPGPCGPSTIGAEGLNCSVRNGKRCFPLAIATGNERELPAALQNCTVRHTGYHRFKKIRQALDPLVPVSFARCRASRSGLSTWWSTRGLTPSRGWENSS